MSPNVTVLSLINNDNIVTNPFFLLSFSHPLTKLLRNTKNDQNYTKYTKYPNIYMVVCYLEIFIIEFIHALSPATGPAEVLSSLFIFIICTHSFSSGVVPPPTQF